MPNPSQSFPVAGQVAPGFEAVRDAFAANFREDVEVGAAFSVSWRGRTVVDLWGGYADPSCTRPWQADTIVCIYSTTKGPAAAAFATLVEDRLIAYEAPVARYWPELRAARGGLTVSQLLSHQAGIPGVRAPLTVQDLYDWPAMIRRLETEEPFWSPGTAAGYHAVTWGFLVGELARRVAGVSLTKLLEERLAAPLHADCSIGLPDSRWDRAAVLIGPNRARRPPGSRRSDTPASARPPSQRAPFNALAMENPVIRPYADVCGPAWRRAELAASNGHASARGLARIYGALAEGGVLGDTRVFEQQTVEALRAEVWGRVPDLVLGYPMRRGRGVNLNTRGELGPRPSAFGHTGTGGSLGFADPEAGLGFGYVMNQLSWGTDRESRAGRLVAATYRCLEQGAGL